MALANEFMGSTEWLETYKSNELWLAFGSVRPFHMLSTRRQIYGVMIFVRVSKPKLR